MLDPADVHDALPETPQPAAATILAGHGDLLAGLLADHAAQRLHHAIMLSGEPGIGKATLAFRFAHQVLTAAGDADASAKIAAGLHPSLLHVTRSRADAGKALRTVISIDDIHRVSHFLSHTAGGSGLRIIIIDPVNDLNASSANALLKNLEEPPKNTHYFLIVQAGGRVLPTIRSRCRLLRVPQLATRDVAAVLRHLGFEAEEAEAFAHSAGGSVREAIVLARYGGQDLAEAIDRLAGARAFSPTLAQSIADAVTARDSAPQYALLMALLEKRVAAKARAAALAGGQGAVQGAPHDAAHLSDVYAEIIRHRATTEAYGLDKRLEVALLLRKLHPVLM